MKLVHQVVTFLLLFVEISQCVNIQEDQEVTTIPDAKELDEQHQETDESDVRNNFVFHDDEQTEVQEAQMKEQRIERKDPDPNLCYQVPVKENCFDKERNLSNCECEQLEEGNVVCCNVTDISKSISCLDNVSIKNIHIINMTENELNLSTMNIFKQVKSLAITHGNITKVSGAFAKFSDFTCLSLANNKITEINDRALIHVVPLKSLDLSGNNITRIPTISNITLNVEGNSKISCINISAAIDKKVNFFNKEKSNCERETNYRWFNGTASLPVSALEKMKKLNEECPEGCKCEPWQMYYRNNTLEVTAKVDCSSHNLDNFPTQMPLETIELIVSNNSISSLTTLIENENYQNVQRLFMDDNKISSIEDLSGTKFFENFTILSLKNNKIKEIPNYILSNLEKNLNSGKLLYLGGNRLTCDCTTFKNIRVWRLINDGNEILCDNMQSRVMEIKETQMCTSGGLHDWSTYINIIIGIEIFLLIALFAKVSYDYYHFKRTGFLPYPASFIILYNQK